MSVIRIDNEAAHTHGWQARWPIDGRRDVTKLFSDRVHGGKRAAKAAAIAAEPAVKRMALKLRRQQAEVVWKAGKA